MARSAADGVVEHLRTEILDGRIRPGHRLAESTLVAQLDVSRNTLREAFRVLAHEGLVEHIANRGVFVRRLTLKEAGDVYRARRILECGALRESALRLASRNGLSAEEKVLFDAEWDTSVAAVQQAVRDGLDAQARRDWEGVGTANGQFHLALTRLAGNEVLDQMLRMLLTESRLLFVVVGAAQDVHERYLEDNIRIAAHVQAGELVRALVALEEYLLRSEKHLVGRYADQLS